MTTFLTIGGIAVKLTRFKERPRVARGEVVRAFDNTLLDGTDAGKREWDGELLVMSLADVDALRAAVAGGPVVCAGEPTRGGEVLCKVTIGDAVYGPDVLTGPGSDWTGFNQTVSIDVKEV